MPILRPAGDGDIETIAGVWFRGWGDGHRGNVPDELVEHRREGDFLALVPERIATTTVAVDGDVVTGFVTVRGDEIEEMYVDAAARGTGVAAALLGHGEHVVARTYAQGWLAVVAGNARARRFYERCGWIDAGPVSYAASLPDGTTLDLPVRRYEKALGG